MFAIARTIIRNKVAAVLLVGAGAFFLMPDGEEEDTASKNPWAVQQAKPAAKAEEPGFVDDMVAQAETFLDEQGINPVSAASDHVGRFDKAASAYESASR